MSEQALLLQRCRVARDYVFSAKNTAGTNSLFQYCQSDAATIWTDLSSKLKAMKYNNSHEFLSDMYQLKQIAIKCSRNAKQLEHVDVVFDRARELAQCKQPLRASLQHKHLTNAFELIIDNCNAENIPVIIDSVFDCGQKFGSLVATESRRHRGAPSSSDSTKKKLAGAANSHNYAAPDSVHAPATAFIAPPNGKKKTGKSSGLRVFQRSPGQDCFPHPLYYGVWQNVHTSFFLAQVTVLGETVGLGQSFAFAHQAAKAVDRSFIRVLGPENCPADALNFDISAYAQEDMETLCQYDAALRVALMFSRDWKGFRPLDFGFLIRRQVLDKHTDVLTEATVELETPDTMEEGGVTAAAIDEASVPAASSNQSMSCESDTAPTACSDEVRSIPEEKEREDEDRCPSPFKRAAKLMRSAGSLDCIEGFTASLTIAERLSRRPRTVEAEVDTKRPKRNAPVEAGIAMPMKRRTERAEPTAVIIPPDQLGGVAGKSRLRNGKTLDKGTQGIASGGDDKATERAEECPQDCEGVPFVVHVEERCASDESADREYVIAQVEAPPAEGRSTDRNQRAKRSSSSRSSAAGLSAEQESGRSSVTAVVKQEDYEEGAGPRKKSRRLQGASVDVQHIIDLDYLHNLAGTDTHTSEEQSTSQPPTTADVAYLVSLSSGSSSLGSGPQLAEETPTPAEAPAELRESADCAAVGDVETGKALAEENDDKRCKEEPALLPEAVESCVIEEQSEVCDENGDAGVRNCSSTTVEGKGEEGGGGVAGGHATAATKKSRRRPQHSLQAVSGPSLKASRMLSHILVDATACRPTPVRTRKSAGETMSSGRPRRAAVAAVGDYASAAKRVQPSSRDRAGRATSNGRRGGGGCQNKGKGKADEEDNFTYVSVEDRNARSKQGKVLRTYVGRTFEDLEVGTRDPFRFCRVADIVQMDGQGPYLFKFFNPKKHKRKPGDDMESIWAYQGCDEIIRSPKLYKWTDT